MKDYLRKLQMARNKLHDVIGRVNSIYGASYDEAIATQKSAARIMTLLGLSIGHKYNPEFSKIKLPREDADECPDCQKKDAKEAAEVSLMELESEVHQQMA